MRAFVLRNREGKFLFSCDYVIFLSLSFSFLDYQVRGILIVVVHRPKKLKLQQQQAYQYQPFGKSVLTGVAALPASRTSPCVHTW